MALAYLLYAGSRDTDAAWLISQLSAGLLDYSCGAGLERKVSRRMVVVAVLLVSQAAPAATTLQFWLLQ